jgi:glycosyltransferase involved in cell wall biosynthesis
VRIALVTRRFWPAVGGIERVALELARALRGLGHNVDVVAQRIDEGANGWLTHTVREAPPFAPFHHDGLSVRQFRLPLSRRLMLLPLTPEAIPLLPRVTAGRTRLATGLLYGRVASPVLARLLGGAEVVHVLGGAWVSVAGVEAARALGRPVAVTPFVHPGHWRDDPASIRSYRGADAVLATVQTDADDLARLGVPTGLISVCGLPVPQVASEPSRAEERLVLFAGARVPHKGIDLLRRAARAVWEQQPGVRFAYVGPGPPLDDADARELDVGPVSDDERHSWFARASVLCLPSASESFGLVVAEAWSARKPVVTADIPVLREQVEAARGGLAVSRSPAKIAEALLRVLGDCRLAEQMGHDGFEHWRVRYRPEAVAERHAAVYSALLERSRHPSRP